MAPRKKLGELLMSEGLIDEVQLSSAIGHQRNWGGKLGSTLVELGFISEDEIAHALEKQLKQECLEDKDLVPDPAVINLLSGQECLTREVLPLRVDGGAIDVAMSNPFDLAVIDELGFKLGKRIRPHLAVESSIKKAVKKYYFGEEPADLPKVSVVAAKADEPMQVEHQSRPKMTEPPPQRKTEPSAEIVSKALAYLLIEKGIIRRDELIEKMKTLHGKSQD